MDQARRTDRLRKKISGRIPNRTMDVSPPLRECVYAVIDLETTGLAAGDRLLEIAIVRFKGDGTFWDQWTTLVNPVQDLGAVQIHGVAGFGEVRHAPCFEDIAADVAKRLAGTVLAAHNLSFDARFLLKEYARIGVEVPKLPMLCTLRLGCKLGAASRGLLATCQQFGIPVGRSHRALDDAIAAARLLGHYLMATQLQGLRVLSDLGCTAALVDPWPPVPTPERAPVLLRPSGDREQSPYLSRLVARLPSDPDPATAEYFGLLDRVLEDFRITLAEAQTLASHAHDAGLGPRLERLNEAYVEGLVQAAWADGVVTEDELEQLRLVSGLLGVAESTLRHLLDHHGPPRGGDRTDAVVRS